jgi:hypothetical protein
MLSVRLSPTFPRSKPMTNQFSTFLSLTECYQTNERTDHGTSYVWEIGFGVLDVANMKICFVPITSLAKFSSNAIRQS